MIQFNTDLDFTEHQRSRAGGNVFTRVCLFTGGPHVTITHDALDLTV